MKEKIKQLLKKVTDELICVETIQKQHTLFSYKETLKIHQLKAKKEILKEILGFYEI